MDDRFGTEISGFRIEAEIGRGGMGVVYLAEQASPRRKVALKVLSPDLVRDPAFRERFTRESEAAASVEHPNVLPVYASGETDGVLFIAMRYVAGEDLRSLLDREGPLPPERAVAICAQVADALQEAHAHGLVHRDVKPGNILIAKGDRAYLTDFGLIRRSKLETDLTKTGQFMGTVDYVAPEQIKGEEVDGRADVYSLGAVLYESLTGEPPYRRDTEVATIYAHLQEPPPRPSARNTAMPATIDRVVTRAMAKRPEDRFPTAAEMGSASRAALGRGASPVAGARRRWLVGLGAAASALVVAIVAVIALGGGDAPVRLSASSGVVLRNGLLAFDPTTHEISAKVPVPYPPIRGAGNVWQPLAAGDGGLWTTSAQGQLLRVDPSTEGTKQIDLGTKQSLGCGIAAIQVGPGAVWALLGCPQVLVRVDPFTFKTRSVPLTSGGTQSIPQSSQSLAIDRANLWVSSSGGSVVQIDAVRGTELGRVSGVTGETVTVGEGKLWVADELASTLTPVSLGSDRVGTPISVPGDVNAVAAGEGGVWVLDSMGGTVTEIDTQSETVRAPISIGWGGADVAVGFGAVWVTKPNDQTLIRIDPVSGQTETFDVHASALSAVPDPQSGELWLAVRS